MCSMRQGQQEKNVFSCFGFHLVPAALKRPIIRSVVVCSSLLDEIARQDYIEDIEEEYEEVRRMVVVVVVVLVVVMVVVVVVVVLE